MCSAYWWNIFTMVCVFVISAGALAHWAVRIFSSSYRSSFKKTNYQSVTLAESIPPNPSSTPSLPCFFFFFVGLSLYYPLSRFPLFTYLHSFSFYHTLSLFLFIFLFFYPSVTVFVSFSLSIRPSSFIPLFHSNYFLFTCLFLFLYFYFPLSHFLCITVFLSVCLFLFPLFLSLLLSPFSLFRLPHCSLPSLLPHDLSLSERERGMTLECPPLLSKLH